MKIKLLLILFCCFVCFAATAQKNNNDNDYKWGIGIQINSVEKFSQYDNLFINDPNQFGEWNYKSYSLGLTGIYSFNENSFLRLKGGFTKIYASLHQDTRDNYPPYFDLRYISDTEQKQNRYYFAPSFAWQLKKNFYTLYGGFDIPLTIHEKYFRTFSLNDYDSTFTIIKDNGIYTSTAPGGFSIGAGIFVGFNINPAKHFAIGAEFSTAFLYSKLGGTIETITTATIPDNFTSTTRGQYLIKGLNYAGEKFSINLIYFF